MNDKSKYSASTFQEAFDVSRETMERLEAYHGLLIKWQKVQNLVAPNTLPDAWERHFADSAQLLSYIGDSKILVDIGSGAGFPGMVLAIMMMDRPDVRLHLVEANGRKCAFLKDVARHTGANVEIHNCRIEVFAIESTIPPVDIIMARALKPLGTLLSLGQFAFDNEATGLFLKGKSFAEEIEVARKDAALRGCQFEAESFDSLTDDCGRIVEISKVRRIS